MIGLDMACSWIVLAKLVSSPAQESCGTCSAGITGLSAVEGNLVLAGITGFLAAFLAFQVT